jgi:ABC-type multidrug transport system ATPase subunit
MITFDHLTKRFGRFTAVDDLSFAVAPREAVALWGANGAGKTTAIKCLLGLLRHAGRIVLDGRDSAADGRAVRRMLGYVPQELAFYDDLGTLDTARFYGRLKGVPAARAVEVLAAVGLADHADKAVGALSGGMKQRLALGLALLADPPVLVLDEPTSNLDAAARDQFLALLVAVKAGGKTIVFTSHRLEEVEALADRVLVMDAGRLQFVCPSDALVERLGLRTRVKFRLPAGAIDAAIAALETGGYRAEANGTGVRVEVAPGEKAGPIHVLARTGIAVHDFEVE